MNQRLIFFFYYHTFQGFPEHMCLLVGLYPACGWLGVRKWECSPMHLYQRVNRESEFATGRDKRQTQRIYKAERLANRTREEIWPQTQRVGQRDMGRSDVRDEDLAVMKCHTCLPLYWTTLIQLCVSAFFSLWNRFGLMHFRLDLLKQITQRGVRWSCRQKYMGWFVFPLYDISDQHVFNNAAGNSSQNAYIWFTVFIEYYTFLGKSVMHAYFQRGCPRGVMVKAMDCGIVVCEFVLQSRYYVHLQVNTLGKGMNPLILLAMG